ncbi:hypothetical protein [Poseidonibacter ostreae]|uniref:Uncharacterized protein n=1 Tax=Poseidonibacter ostreae TaxID=2654171 RepID=A0A6L4WZJ9_9BACT|nr:hypothetical protein [Poseidonibacter ostreae]KAB7891414.1 hypothetical protein GBG19_00835 [Poseidonibacter ostreae]
MAVKKYKIEHYENKLHKLRFLGEDRVGEIHRTMTSTEYKNYIEEVETELQKHTELTLSELETIVYDCSIKVSTFVFSDKAKPKTDFVTTSGKNIGEVQNTALGNFFDLTEGSIRSMRNKYPKRFKALYLGAFCIANDIEIEDLRKVQR